MDNFILNHNKNMNDKMKQTTNVPIIFDWNDNHLIDNLMFKIERVIINYKEEKNVKDILEKINNKIDEYNFLRLNRNQFLKELKPLFDEIENHHTTDSYNLLSYFENKIKSQYRIILHGPGGIGKSSFIHDLCLEYEKNSINYLVFYGKWFVENSIELIDDFIQINKTSKRYVLLIDAINEIKQDERARLLDKVVELIDLENLSIIITYRDNAIDLCELNKIKYHFLFHIFEGVDYKPSIREIISQKNIDISEYEDILVTNNPLYLNILISKITDIPEKTNIISITHIMEQYIKNKKCCNLKCWDFTKEIAKLMFEKGRKDLKSSEINSLKIENKNSMINKLIEFGFLREYQYSDEKWYSFTNDVFSDFLIARSIFDEKNNDSFIDIVNDKINKITSLKEMLPLVFFECYNTSKEAIEILKKFSFEARLETLSMIKYRDKDYLLIQKEFGDRDLYECFLYVGGCPNKPYNCINYINNKLLNKDLYMKFAKLLTDGYYIYDDIERIVNKLKVIVDYLDFNMNNLNENNERLEEYFWYSIWCLGLGKKNIYFLAIKILVMLIEISNNYIKKIIDNYALFDEIIKENLIIVLTSCPNNTKVIQEEFLKSIYYDKAYFHCENLARISNFLFGNLDNIILLNKEFDLNDDYVQSKETMKIIERVELYDKSALRFYSNYDGTFYMYDHFLDYNKKYIAKINAELAQNYKCMIYGKCNRISELPYKIAEKLNFDPQKYVDVNYIVKIFCYFFELYCEKYDLPLSSDINYDNFGDSFLFRILMIAQNDAFGFIMSKYYSSEFISGYDHNYIGFKTYNPLEYLYSNFNPFGVIPGYFDLGFKLDSFMEAKIPKCEKNILWADDIELSKKIMKDFLKPIEYKNVLWKPIGFRIERYANLNKENQRDWKELYMLFINLNPNAHLNGNAYDNKFIIDKSFYVGNINDYKDKKDFSDACYYIPTLMGVNSAKKLEVLIPPSKLVCDLNLRFNSKLCCWVNEKNEIIIICNKKTKIDYTDSIENSMYIRNDIYNQYIQHNNIHYFGFTEKLHSPKGPSDKSAFDCEMNDTEFIDLRLHYKDRSSNYIIPKICEACFLYKEEKKEIDNILWNSYNYSDIMKFNKKHNN